MGVVAFWAPTDSESWQALATLDAQRPSTLVRTGWPTRGELVGAPSVRVCMALLNTSDVNSAAMTVAASESAQLSFVQLVARDLAAYLTSFVQRGVPGLGRDAIVLPADAAQRWLARFDAKFRAEGTAFLGRSPF